MLERMVTNSIIIHHSESDRYNTTAAMIRKWHTSPDKNDPSKPWSDIGYHYVIRGRGELEPGRKESLNGAHCPNWNYRSVGICLTGSFTKGHDQLVVGEPQYESLISLATDICQRYKIDPSQIFGHGEKYATSCPGTIQDLMPTIRSAVRAGLSGTESAVSNG